MRPLAFPARINVEVTNRCNQACRFCPRGELTRPLGLMDPALFARIAGEVAPYDTVLWMHFLGEPLLHPRLLDLIRTAKDAGVSSVGLSTNATLLDEELGAGLIASGLDRLDCSLDADDRHTYEQMRGADHFERATGNVRSFLAHRLGLDDPGPAVSLQFMRTPAFDARAAEIVEAWRPLLGPDDFVKTIVPAQFHGAVPEGDAPGGTTERPPCPWLFASLMVLQDGTVTMCGADWDAGAPLGHLGSSTLTDVWRGAEADRRRQAHLDGRFGDVELCGDCTDWHLADGHGYATATPDRGDRRGPVAVALRRN